MESRTETFKYYGEQTFKIGETDYVFPHTYVLLPTASFEAIDWVSGDKKAQRLGGLEIVELEGVAKARDWLFIKAKVASFGWRGFTSRDDTWAEPKTLVIPRAHYLFIPFSKVIYSNVRWYVYIIQIATNVIYVKVLAIVAEICTTFKDNSNM